MAEVNNIFPQDEAKKVIEVGNAIKQADDALLKYTKDADALIQMLQKQGLTVDQLNKAQTKANETVIKITQTNDKLKKSEETLSRLEKERIKIRQQQKEVLTKNIAAEEKSYKVLQKGREALKNKNREIRLSIKAEQALKGSYDAISAALSKNLIKYKKLSAAERENSKAGKNLEATIKRQRAELSKLDQRLGNHTRNVGNYRSALAGSAKSLIGAFGVVGGVMAFASVLRNATGVITNFTSEQSRLAALSGKTKEELSGLTEQAKLLGSVTQFTATQVTGLQIELTKLGFATSEIELSTKAILNLSTATGSELSDSAKVAGIALRVFGLDASRMNEVAATLAVSTTKSALSFQDFETILSNAGPVARSYGFSLQDLIALSGKLRDAGFDASKGSTALRNILLNLADTNGKLSKELGGNIDNFDDLIPALIELRERGVSLNETLQLTDKRSVAAFNQFLNTAEGASELRDSITGVNDELQVMVDKQLDNLAGDITKLSSAWEGLVLTADEGAGVFRKAVQFATDALVKVANIDLIFKRSSKFTEDEVSRMWDVLMSLNDKKAKEFRDVISQFDATDFAMLGNFETEFKQLIDAAGYNATEAALLWDEYLKRRQEQNELEIQAAKDKEKQLLEQEEKAAEKENEAARKASQKAAKDKQKLEKKNADDLSEIRTELEEESRKRKEKAAEDELKAGEELIEADIARTEELVEIEKAGIEEIDRLKAEKRQKEQEEERAELQRKAELYQNFTNIIADSFFDFAQGNKDALKEGAKAIIITALDVLKAQTQMAIVSATIQSLVQPDSIATFGASGLARAAILTGLIEAAFAGVQGLVAGFAEGTDNAPGRFVAGEKGRELMMLRTGEIMMVDKPTYFEGSKYKGATIKSNPETEKIIAQSDKRGNFVFDDKGLRDDLKAVRRAIERKPVNVIDHKSGSIIGKQSGNYREIYINKLRNGR